jgi:SAM-dependent methyltransferase
MPHSVERLYESRSSKRWRERVRRGLMPPAPLIMNPREPRDFPLGRWNLYIGGGGTQTPGYVNIDLFPLPGVDVVADAHHLPFRCDLFSRVECDAVLEHVRKPDAVVDEIRRVLAPGGFVHLVAPFCHPFHEYPEDYRRFTIPALKQMCAGLDVVASGWRTGPTATLLVFLLEYVKLWLPFRPMRAAAHGILGWLLFPARYLDLILLRRPDAGRLGNHCYLWARKAEIQDGPPGCIVERGGGT